jgi:hypothetical protein
MNRLNQVSMKQTEANVRFDNNLGVGSAWRLDVNAKD